MLNLAAGDRRKGGNNSPLCFPWQIAYLIDMDVRLDLCHRFHR